MTWSGSPSARADPLAVDSVVIESIRFESVKLTSRARIHAALGDPARLQMVDRLLLSDRTFRDLATSAGLAGNAAAHHLAVLEAAGLIERRVSEGDHRRRYIAVRHGRLAGALGRPGRHAPPGADGGSVLFVCTHNSARSQFAAALWKARTAGTAESAGTEPAERVHPKAVKAAARLGIDLSRATPKGYEAVSAPPALVVSVCDLAREAGLPFQAPSIHWSIPDPVRDGSNAAFRLAFERLSERIDRLAQQAGVSLA